MIAWEYRTVDISQVAFGNLPETLARLKRRGWQLAPAQAMSQGAHLRIGMRRPVRLGQIAGWLWLAG